MTYDNDDDDTHRAPYRGPHSVAVCSKQISCCYYDISSVFTAVNNLFHIYTYTRTTSVHHLCECDLGRCDDDAMLSSIFPRTLRIRAYVRPCLYVRLIAQVQMTDCGKTFRWDVRCGITSTRI